MNWFGYAIFENGAWRLNWAETKIAEFDWDAVLSPAWRKAHVKHFLKLPEASVRYGISHILLVEGPHDTWEYLRFGPDKIHGNFIVLGWDEARREPVFLHCEHCAEQILGWIMAAQVVWRNDAMVGGPAYESEGVSLYQ